MTARQKAGDVQPAARRLTPKGEATRARLIELAAEVFADEGYATVSMRDIVNRSGLSSGAIYGSFKGKADLLAEAVDATIASDVETLPTAVTEQLTLPEIDAYQFEHLPQRDRCVRCCSSGCRGARRHRRARAFGVTHWSRTSIWQRRRTRNGAIHLSVSTRQSTCACSSR